MMRNRALSVAVLLTIASLAAAEDLSDFLRAVSEAGRPPVPLRADGELSIQSPDRQVKDQLILFLTPQQDLYIELRKAGVKALLLRSGSEAFRSSKGGKAEPFALDDTLAGSDFTREDLQPFSPDRYDSPTIVDRSAQHITVSLNPRQSQYSLVADTFDRDKKVLLKGLNYKETLSNLVKMRQDRDHVSVAGRWLPTSITMQHFQLRTQSTMNLKWREAPDVSPDLFQQASLARPSGLQWPDISSASEGDCRFSPKQGFDKLSLSGRGFDFKGLSPLTLSSSKGVFAFIDSLEGERGER